MYRFITTLKENEFIINNKSRCLHTNSQISKQICEQLRKYKSAQNLLYQRSYKSIKEIIVSFFFSIWRLITVTLQTRCDSNTIWCNKSKLFETWTQQTHTSTFWWTRIAKKRKKFQLLYVLVKKHLFHLSSIILRLCFKWQTQTVINKHTKWF